MAKKKKQPVEATRKWVFPTLGKTVSAGTYEEALKLATEPEKDEASDD